MSEIMKAGIHEYTYDPGLTGDVRIDNVTTTPDNVGGWQRQVGVEIPGEELKQLVKQGAPRPMVGVGILLVDEIDPDNIRVLLGRRKGAHGEGRYAGPGGHLENGESFENAALRELEEECGPSLLTAAPRFLCVTNLRAYLPKHYGDIGMVVRYHGGTVKNMEPDKCEGWEWFPIDDLPTPRFGAVDNYVTAYQSGRVYFPDADA